MKIIVLQLPNKNMELPAVFDFPEVLDILNFPQPERGKFQHASNTPKQTGIGGKCFKELQRIHLEIAAEIRIQPALIGKKCVSMWRWGNYEDCNGSARCWHSLVTDEMIYSDLLRKYVARIVSPLVNIHYVATWIVVPKPKSGIFWYELCPLSTVHPPKFSHGTRKNCHIQ